MDAGNQTKMHADAIVRLDDRIGMTFGVDHSLFVFPDTVPVFEVHSMNLTMVACSIYPIRHVFSIALFGY